MAKKATAKAPGTSRKPKSATKAKTRALVRTESRGGGKRSGAADGLNAGDAFIKLLQSPLVAELLAVAATAALAALAEHGFTTGGGSRGKRAGKAVKEAGKAAASAIGRRLTNEIDEIKKASKKPKDSAAA